MLCDPSFLIPDFSSIFPFFGGGGLEQGGPRHLPSMPPRKFGPEDFDIMKHQRHLSLETLIWTCNLVNTTGADPGFL